MTALLHAQLDAARAATTAEQAVAYEQHLGCRATVALLIADQPALARKVLARAVERQARMAGIGGVHIDLPAEVPSCVR